MDNSIIIRKATEDELDKIASLYSSAVGREGCTWNTFYPTREDAERDIDADSLFVCLSGGKIIGAASVVPENELDELPFWKFKSGKEKEVARITIEKSASGRSLARYMLEKIFDVLKKDGVPAIHLLVAKCNPAAIKTYKNLGFEFLGEYFMYGNDYFACEKKL